MILLSVIRVGPGDFTTHCVICFMYLEIYIYFFNPLLNSDVTRKPTIKNWTKQILLFTKILYFKLTSDHSSSWPLPLSYLIRKHEKCLFALSFSMEFSEGKNCTTPQLYFSGRDIFNKGIVLTDALSVILLRHPRMQVIRHNCLFSCLPCWIVLVGSLAPLNSRGSSTDIKVLFSLEFDTIIPHHIPFQGKSVFSFQTLDHKRKETSSVHTPLSKIYNTFQWNWSTINM